jgi:asparagine synthase (glutamine-hydrolysing)
MCGIAGQIGPRPLAEERRRSTLVAMRHRGPDHQAHTSFTGADRAIDLLHARLSIIDLDQRSSQPFTRGPLTVVYNGEIYNYVEVRKELERFGDTFVTTSDTEVLLAALLRWGDQALDQLEGMWAFAVHDARDGSVLFSRDRFGEKPFYLYQSGDAVYFASEVNFIASMRGGRLPVDLEQLRRYLVNGYKALYKQTHTFFVGLEELPAGSWLRVDEKGRRTRGRYWTPRFEEAAEMSYDEAVRRTRDLLIRAVQIRLRADVPLAFCMSGGVDSNALISIAKRELGYDVHGFTIANKDARYEESDLIAASVKELGVRHTSIPTQADHFLPQLRALVKAHDAPVYTITYYAHWLLQRSIAEHGYKIAISGTAADELFTGYYDHHLGYLADVKGDAALHASSLAAWKAHIQPEVRNPFLRDPELFVRDRGFRDHIYLDAEGFSAMLTQPFAERFAETAFTPRLLRNRMLNELFHEAVPVILHEDDLNAMFFSIENRSPFLDRALFEHSCSIPTRHLIRDGFGKAVLRDAIRGIAPDLIVDNRRKVGFNAPIFDFLDMKDPAVRAEVLAPSPIFDVVRRDAITPMFDKVDLPNSQSKFLFYFLCSKMFLEELAA